MTPRLSATVPAAIGPWKMLIFIRLSWEGRKVFFSEEKKQKTFDFLGVAVVRRALQEQKFFASFFSKKKALPIPVSARAPQPGSENT